MRYFAAFAYSDMIGATAFTDESFDKPVLISGLGIMSDALSATDRGANLGLNFNKWLAAERYFLL